MKKETQDTGYTFWKRPWGKWCVLAGAVLQLAAMEMKLREYRTVIDSGVFSETARAEYIAGTRLSLACSGLLTAMLLGEFLVGCLVRSKKQELLAEGVLLLALSAAWAAAYWALDLYSTRGRTGIFFLVLLLGGAGYCLWKWRGQE